MYIHQTFFPAATSASERKDAYTGTLFVILSMQYLPWTDGRLQKYRYSIKDKPPTWRRQKRKPHQSGSTRNPNVATTIPPPPPPPKTKTLISMGKLSFRGNSPVRQSSISAESSVSGANFHFGRKFCFGRKVLFRGEKVPARGKGGKCPLGMKKSAILREKGPVQGETFRLGGEKSAVSRVNVLFQGGKSEIGGKSVISG